MSIGNIESTLFDDMYSGSTQRSLKNICPFVHTTKIHDVFHKLHVGKIVDMEKGDSLIDLEGNLDAPLITDRSSFSQK